MSTYYFIVCDDHKERTDAASRTAGGHCHLANSSTTLLPFIIAHCGCRVRIVHEHEDDSYGDEFREWEEENIEEEIRIAREDGRWR